MTPRQFAPHAGPAHHKIAIHTPLLVAPVVLAMLAFTVIGLSSPFMQFDLAAKIQESLLH